MKCSHRFALVNAVMNIQVPWNVGNFLTSWKLVSFSQRTLLQGVSKYVIMPLFLVNGTITIFSGLTNWVLSHHCCITCEASWRKALICCSEIFHSLGQQNYPSVYQPLSPSTLIRFSRVNVMSPPLQTALGQTCPVFLLVAVIFLLRSMEMTQW